jgi:hypothetical protein
VSVPSSRGVEYTTAFTVLPAWNPSPDTVTAPPGAAVLAEVVAGPSAGSGAGGRAVLAVVELLEELPCPVDDVLPGTVLDVLPGTVDDVLLGTEVDEELGGTDEELLVGEVLEVEELGGVVVDVEVDVLVLDVLVLDVVVVFPRPPLVMTASMPAWSAPAAIDTGSAWSASGWWFQNCVS